MKLPLLLALVLRCAVVLAGNNSLFDQYCSEVIGALGLLNLPAGANDPVWVMPTGFVFGATSVSTEQIEPDRYLLDRKYRLVFSDGTDMLVCHAYPPLNSNNFARVLGNALGGPSNLPAPSFASMFSVNTNVNDLIVIEPRFCQPSRDFAVAIFNDAIVRVDTSTTNRIELASAILCAGGIDLQQDPPAE